MQSLVIVPTTSQLLEQVLSSLIQGGFDEKSITPCNYTDAELFITDPKYSVIFLEMDDNQMAESFNKIDQIKQINPMAKVIPILGVKDSDLIIQLVKKNIDDVLVAPLDPTEIMNLHQSLQSDPGMAAMAGVSGGSDGAASRKGKIITVTSYKGGTGVSTVATNLAFCLAELDALRKKTLIVDLANQSNHCARLLGTNITLNIHSLCSNIDEMGSAYIMSQCPWITDTLSIIGSDTSLDSLVDGIDFEKLETALNILANAFDYVIIDLPTHTFDARFLASLEVSDEIILVSTLDINAVVDTQNFIKVARDLGIDQSKIRLLINRYDTKEVVFKNKDLEKALEFPVSFYVHNDYFSATKASQSQMAIMEANPRSIVAEDFAEMAVGVDSGMSFVPVAGRGGAATAGKSKGLFGIFGK